MRLWTIEEGVDFCRRLNAHLEPIGYGVALTGSVLFKGKSHKDIDLIVFPLSTAKMDEALLRHTIMNFGIRPWIPMEELHELWRKKGSEDTKHVEIWRFGIRRIDLFFLK
jgi:hypothetical protein